ncbi:hypothetical protein TRFO_30574 [Tritrichomonas foetus]|uniref:UBA domain-containing protein n=1 Tax=Tritrichomonas foetus TaxID=1144522 RepID=A0A1J4JTC4_9EUKA|nr:hypothetical protein TRFO_30574 [Tritrichomonas foetus]|eukprot:OHT02377.1 hypothetical protein TRFO_30574 [Tritrichomonas foetus]
MLAELSKSFFPPKSMNVHFKTQSGIDIVLNLTLQETIYHAKRMLAEKLAIDFRHIFLFLNSYLLNDNITFGDLNIDSESTIGLRIHYRSPFESIGINPSRGTNSDDLVKQLLQYGFEPDDCLQALKLKKNCFEQALDFLLESGSKLSKTNSKSHKSPPKPENPRTSPFKPKVSSISGDTMNKDINELVELSGGNLPRHVIKDIYLSLGKNKETVIDQILNLITDK